ncbi:class I SAM-dependent methyltransferase [Candidatus Daviesbacteria bacterium]|nr:class I SAM-dependent methyltransferase [Candidatus Daviesbacteria bacterium]
MDNLIVKNLRGFEIKFKTKPGVFSKNNLDLGSQILIEHLKVSDKILIADLGCGSGVIGFVAAKLNPKGHVHLLDVNLRFVKLAKTNANLNKLNNVEVYLSDLFSAVETRTYNLILSNPPQHLGNEFLEESAKECFKHLKVSGEVWWVVQKHLKSFVERLFNNVFKNCEVLYQGQDYALLKAKRS